MDTRRLILAMALSLLVMFGYQWFIARYYPAAKPQVPATQPVAATSQSGNQAPVAAWQPAQRDESTWHVRGADSDQQVVLGEDTPSTDPGSFFTQAFLTNRGAAVETVQLVAKQKKGKNVTYKYAQAVGDKSPFTVLAPLATPADGSIHSWQTQSIRVLPSEAKIPLHDVPWMHEIRRLDDGSHEARFWVDVFDGPQPVVRVIKRYVLAPQSYAIDMGLTFESLTGREVQLVVNQLGPVGIVGEDLRNDFRKVFVVNDNQGRPVPVKWTHADLVKKGQAVVGSASPILWTALVDKYFAAITSPAMADNARAAADVRVYAYSRDSKATGDLAAELTSAPITVQPNQSASLRYDLYVGPKDSQVFAETPRYADRGYNLMNSAEYAWCTFSSLGELMTWLLHGLNNLIWPHNYGVAIIILVLLVRVILHPLTKHQQVAMTRMQQKQAEIAPKIEAVKQRYANDRAQLQAETMRVYREAGINPAGQIAGCLPMLIQMPIWVALYSALNYDINLRHAPFVLWIQDLSAPDAFLHWQNAINIPLISWFIGEVNKLNILPIFLAVAMFLQQKFTPKPKPVAGTSPEQLAQQQQMQKMMGFMMIFMGLLFYNMPSGLCLYIMASSAFGILEQYRIRKHIERQPQVQPAAAKPSRRNTWMNKMMEKMEKQARQSQTIRKDK